LIIDRQLQRVRRQLLYRQTKTVASDASLPLPEIVATALRLRREQQDKARTTSRAMMDTWPNGSRTRNSSLVTTPAWAAAGADEGESWRDRRSRCRRVDSGLHRAVSAIPYDTRLVGTGIAIERATGEPNN
jgi:hypothetical protein